MRGSQRSENARSQFCLENSKIRGKDDYASTSGRLLIQNHHYTSGSRSWIQITIGWRKIREKKALFFCETPQTDSEPVRGLENWTPRGHCINKNKNQILVWNFLFFRYDLDQNTKYFFEKSQNPKKGLKFEKSHNLKNHRKNGKFSKLWWNVLKMFRTPFRSERSETFKNMFFSKYRSNACDLRQTVM